MTMLWQASPDQIAAARLSAFMGSRFDNYADLQRWSVEQPEAFWTALWQFAGVIGDPGGTVLADGGRMPGASWFPEARLNFAENLLRHGGDGDAIVFWGEDKVKRRLSRAELYAQAAQLAAAMRALGIVAGDRVAAYMPNLPETIVAMLAAASIGAIFSSASPDFGVQGVLDRFGQIAPRLLIAADGYWYNGKPVDSLAKIAAVAEQLPGLERVLIVPYLQETPDLSAIGRAQLLADFVAGHGDAAIEFTRLPFAHPLYIMYSSGTTGVPKCIVHSAGGTLLQHLKEHQLHGDVRPGDRLFYFTTCGWMMWNWLASGLASGATLLLYDGSPFARRGNILFDYADAEGMTHFGTSAKFIDAIAKISLAPMRTHKLASLRAMFSTGSPLLPESFDYVYNSVKADLHLASISGGTDIVSCFVLGNPISPVYRGEIQGPGLGMAVQVFDDAGRPVRE